MVYRLENRFPQNVPILVVKLFVIFIIATSVICSIADGTESNYQWLPIPLTTAPQAKQSVKGGEGFQQVLSIEYAQSNPKIVYMCSDTTQVWKSTDSGHLWHVASEGIDSNGACSLFVHPQNPNIVFAAACLGPEANRAQKRQKRREGIFRTIDGGKSWLLIHKTEFHKQRSNGSLFVADLRTLNKKELTLYAGSYSDGLLISHDTGQTWLKAGFNKGIIKDIEVSPAEPGLLIIATSKGLYLYRDGLVEQIGLGLIGAPSNIAVSPATPNRVTIVADDAGIFVSNNQGKSFQRSTHGLPPTSLSKIVNVYASPVDANQLYASTYKSQRKGPFYSEDGGKSWKKTKTLNAKGLTDGGGFWFPSPIAPHPQEPLVALAASNGRTRILRTINGGKTWQYSGSGYTGGRVIDIAFVSQKEWYLALTDHGLWRTTDCGMTFKYIEIPDVHPRSIGAVAVANETIVCSVGGWKDKQIAVSNNQGKSWQQFKQISGLLNFIRFHPQKENVIYASAYRSVDKGRSWTKLKHKVQAVFSDNGNVVYGFDKDTSTIVESDDMGTTWHSLAYCDDNDIGINEIAADPHIQSCLYMGTNFGLYRVTSEKCVRIGPKDGFTRDTHGSLAVRSVLVNPANNSVIYAGRWAPGKGTSSGIFRSEDFGHTWASFNNGIDGSFNVWSVEIEPKGLTVYISATHGLHAIECRAQKAIGD